MPKRAIIRQTNSVKSGPRRHGGGQRNNGWKPPCLLVGLLLAFAVLAPPVAVAAFWGAVLIEAASR